MAGLFAVAIIALFLAPIVWLIFRGTPEQREQKGKIFLGCIFGLAILSMVGMCSDSSKESTTRDQERDDEIQARYAVKYAVEGVLKAPASAKFQNPNEFIVRKLAKNVWEVSGYVDAQNSFGAMLRNHFTITLTKIDGQWKPLDAKIE